MRVKGRPGGGGSSICHLMWTSPTLTYDPVGRVTFWYDSTDTAYCLIKDKYNWAVSSKSSDPFRHYRTWWQGYGGPGIHTFFSTSSDYWRENTLMHWDEATCCSIGNNPLDLVGIKKATGCFWPCLLFKILLEKQSRFCFLDKQDN